MRRAVSEDARPTSNDMKLAGRMVLPTFHPEYGRYMLESTPGAPYSGAICDLLSVEDNMRFR
jgi:glutamate--cysteine ligase catalytic subunit